MRLLASLSAFPLLLGKTQSAPVESFQSRCEILGSRLCLDAYPGFNVTIAEYLPAGYIINQTAEGINETCTLWGPPPLPVSICRIALTVPTSKESSIKMEAWLPEDWSGRFLSTGNGGFGGCIQYGDLAYATSFGFAAVGTNNGHAGMSGGAFFHAPEVLRDFVWRALYTGVVVGKDIATQFYGKRYSKSYYLGCSTGGRQGWKAIQDHPELFDGVVAGAPAINFNGLIAWIGYALETLGGNSSDTFLTTEDWAQVHGIVLEQCDKLDGAEDGILEDTRECRPDFKPWLCKADSTSHATWCLTRAQLSSIDKLFSPFVVNGTTLAPGAAHGDEARLMATAQGDTATTWVGEWFQYVVKQDLSWNRSTYTVQDGLEAYDLNPFNLATYNGDISAFRDRGGKILHWHGQADEYITGKNSDSYYDVVAKTLKASPAELDHFYRYFRISGLGHCYGGPGTNILGQGYGMAASNDPDDNILVRIVEWVEKGNAPEIVRATKYVNDDPTQGVAYARRHCKHPKVNKYFGTGNGTDEDGWHCIGGVPF